MFCARCRTPLQAHDLQYECDNQKCAFYGKRLCSACTTVEPHLGEYTRPVFPGDRWFRISICIALGVTAAVAIRGEVGLGGAIVIGLLAAVLWFLFMMVPDEMWFSWRFPKE